MLGSRFLERSWKALLLILVVYLVINSTHWSFRASSSQQAPGDGAKQNPCTAVLTPEILQVPGGTIEVSFAPGQFDLPKETILNWIRRAGTAVSTYYGRFPVLHTTVRIVPVEGEDGIFHGITFGDNGGFTRIPLGQHTTEEELKSDWIMTHEFVHLAFPDMPQRHHWIEEGLATYVEPIARAQAGQLTPASIWRDMMRDMPKGEPGAGDRGLDYTHTWARTYWGGALYCLQADVEIRRLTNNRKGLQDALRALVAAGGNLETRNWKIERALRIADEGTGTRVLEKLYDEMKATPVEVNLGKIWSELGVINEKGKIKLDRHAHFAASRVAITQTPRAEAEPGAP
jgi:hypothetical protein